jgi:hypothetical protein
LELAGCTRFAQPRQTPPLFIPTDEVLPHHATDTGFPAQFAGNWLSVEMVLPPRNFMKKGGAGASACQPTWFFDLVPGFVEVPLLWPEGRGS